MAELTISNSAVAAKIVFRHFEWSAKKAPAHEELKQPSQIFDLLDFSHTDQLAKKSKSCRKNIKSFAAALVQTKKCYKSFSDSIATSEGKQIFQDLLLSIASAQVDEFAKAWCKAHGDRDKLAQVGAALIAACSTQSGDSIKISIQQDCSKLRLRSADFQTVFTTSGQVITAPRFGRRHLASTSEVEADISPAKAFRQWRQEFLN